MKTILVHFYTLLVILLLSSCLGNTDTAGEGRVYQVSATIDADSTMVTDGMSLYVDNHVHLHTFSPADTESFSAEFRTSGLDELYLCTDGGELCRFYATAGMQVGLSVHVVADSIAVSFTAEGDTINPWIQQHQQKLAAMSVNDRRALLDSLSHQSPQDIRNTLLLRDEIEGLSDSLFVRRCLGALADEAKPDWLLKSIGQVLDETSVFWVRNRRLASAVFQASDSTSLDLSASRTDYLLFYFWGAYSEASIDSLRAMETLVTQDYGMKRLQMVSLCLDAPDSAWWQSKVEGLDGNHIWLRAGLSDKRIRNWNITQLPFVILTDMYCNQQQRNVWGKDLQNALNRLPNKSGFAHSQKLKPNGRPNNLSRPSGH